MKVAGKNVVIEIKVGDVWTLYACAKSATLNVATDFIETSVAGAGKFATYLPTKISFTGTLEGVTSLEQDGMLSLPDLRARQLTQEKLRTRFQRTSDDGKVYTDEAYFFISSSNDVGSFDDMNIFTIEMQGTGILTQYTDSYPPYVPAPFDYQFGTTDLDTSVPNLEVAFVASVQAVLDASGELTGTAPDHGANISISDFGSTDYKVCWFRVPATEDPFTLWSEKGNALQQDQPILEFGTGFSVWTRSTLMPGLYFTAYQTKFAGTIEFSR